MIPTYSPFDFADLNDLPGQDWTNNMMARGDSLAVAISAQVLRVDGQAITSADATVDTFQIVVGTGGMKTAFRLTKAGQKGVSYFVRLTVLTTNNVTLNRDVLLPVTRL